MLPPFNRFPASLLRTHLLAVIKKKKEKKKAKPDRTAYNPHVSSPLGLCPEYSAWATVQARGIFLSHLLIITLILIHLLFFWMEVGLNCVKSRKTASLTTLPDLPFPNFPLARAKAHVLEHAYWVSQQFSASVSVGGDVGGDWHATSHWLWAQSFRIVIG